MQIKLLICHGYKYITDTYIISDVNWYINDTCIPKTLCTPYIWYKPHTISLITVFRPGQSPPHVTIQACTSSESKYTCQTFKSLLFSHKLHWWNQGLSFDTKNVKPSEQAQHDENGSLLDYFCVQLSAQRKGNQFV